MGPKGSRGNEISHRFGLKEVHPIIQEGALRKLAGVRLPGPKLKATLKQGSEYHRATMALKLYDVLSREGVGAGKIDHEAFVEGVPGAIAQACVVRVARRQGAPATQLKPRPQGLRS
jgi:hypothetical protein